MRLVPLAVREPTHLVLQHNLNLVWHALSLSVWVARPESSKGVRITDRLHNEIKLDADSHVPTDLFVFSVQTE